MASEGYQGVRNRFDDIDEAIMQDNRLSLRKKPDTA
jgi:hypothetical protein